MWNRHHHRPSRRRSVLWPLAVLALAWASSVGAASRPQGALPLAFVPNTGQTDAAVRFEVRGRGGHLFFSEREVVFSLPSNVLRLRFVDASPSADVVAGAPLPGTFNSFTGNDPSRWRRGLPTYDGVVYRGLYPGVNLVYEGREGTLKGTYTLAPGVDPALLRWRYEGASALRIDGASGDLHVVLPDGDPVVERAPVAWQDLEGARRAVDVRFVLLDGGAVGFRVGRHDPEVPLTIDPALVYSTFLGGDESDEALGLAVDPAGAVYLAGSTYSSTFPLVSPFQSTSSQGEGFVSKLDPVTNVVIFSTFLGGSDADFCTSVALGNGEIYVTGSTDSPDFPLLNPAQGFAGGFDAFLVRLDAGGGLLTSSYLGGSEADYGSSVAFDSALQEVVVAGHTHSVNFPLVNAWQWTNAGQEDFFVTRLDAAAGGLLASTYFGGERSENNPHIAVDARGTTHLVGSTDSFLLPTINAPQTAFAGGFSDVVVARFDDHMVPLFSTYHGGSGFDSGTAVAVNGQEETIAVGSTRSWDLPITFPSYQPFLNGLEDAFVARYDLSGAQAYSSFLGGSAEDGALGVAVDGNDFLYLTGGTYSADFPQAASWQAALNGFEDAFVAVLDAAGTSLLFSTFLGGGSEEWGTAVAVGPGDLAYVTGFTDSYDFPTVTPWQHNLQGAQEAFLSILDTEASRCREIFWPGEIPAPTVIGFDNLPSHDVIGTAYLASHGVTFEDTSLTQTLAFSNPANAVSPQNEATNIAVYPNVSANIPMKIEFSGPKTHVGMWAGNGETEQPTAVLTAFDGAGNLICQFSWPGVPEPDTLYLGLHDPRGRIRTLTLDYGATWLVETIDDLAFSP